MIAVAEPSREPSRRSVLRLDGMSFFLGFVRVSPGFYLMRYPIFSGRGWSPESMVIAMAAMWWAMIACQPFAGALIDRIRWKRAATASAAGVIAAGCAAIYARPPYPVTIVSLLAMGAAASIFAPAIAALSLGIVGRARFARRVGRNEACGHLGGLASFLAIESALHYSGSRAALDLIALATAAAAVAAMTLPEEEIDHALARGASEDEGGEAIGVNSMTVPFTDRRLLVFTACAVIFCFAGGAMSLLAVQEMMHDPERVGIGFLGVPAIAAPLVAIPVALAAGWYSESRGRKPVFLIGFAALSTCGLLHALASGPYALATILLLASAGMGIYGVVSVLIVADLTRGTGRFNLALGAVATAAALGAAPSKGVGGYVVKAWGFDAGFLTLAAIAVAGLALFALGTTETRAATTVEPAGGLTPRPA